MAKKSPAAKVPAEWIRNPIDELAAARGYTFDAEAGAFVCDFIETFCCLSEDEWAGKPLKLIPWERDWLMRLFGWKQPDGRRRFKSSYLEVAKKNGKSPLVSALSLYALLGDNAGGPKVYCNACDREQARIVFEAAAAMVDQSPELKKRLDVVNSQSRIVWPEGRGVLIANSSTVDSKDGRNASLVIFDELHRQPDRKLWEVFRYAGASRRQPLRISITTAGESEDGVWFEQREYSEQVNAGIVEDLTHLGVVYRADPTADLADPEVWRTANPSLGYTLDLEAFAADYAQARANPLDWNNFLRLRLNIVARASAKYFDVTRWDACAAARRLTTADLRGHPCFAGLDLSSTEDLTALVFAARLSSGQVRMITRFWCPEENLTELERKTKQPYKLWADHGYMIPTPGNVIDYEFIRDEILELCGELALTKGLIDRWNAQKLANELIEKDGLPFEFLQQGYLSLSGPTKEFKRLMDAGQIEHDGNPIMRWCVANAVATQDDQQNVKLSKQKSRLKIDGAAAAVNTIAALGSDDSNTGQSVYDSRGVLYL